MHEIWLTVSRTLPLPLLETSENEGHLRFSVPSFAFMAETCARLAERLVPRPPRFGRGKGQETSAWKLAEKPASNAASLGPLLPQARSAKCDRREHPWGYLLDEASFVPEAGECYNEALAAAKGSIILNSSAGPGWFADARHDRIFVPNAR
jgi:hypothetical protein